MVRFLVCVALLATLVLCVPGKSYSIQRLLHAIDEVGEAAKMLTDPKMQQAIHMVQKKIKGKIARTQLDQDQLTAANELLQFITSKMRAGKVRLAQIKHFIDFAQSDKLDILLATWDKKLLKSVNGT